MDLAGRIRVDAGAVRALNNGRSLLPAGVALVTGSFERGDIVAVDGPDGIEIARGITAYSSEDAMLIAGHHSQEIESILGFAGREEMIHRDDLAMTQQQDGANHAD